MSQHSPFSMIDAHIAELLSSEDITLTEEQKNFYIPQLSMFAEKQLSSDLMSRLSSEDLVEFEKLLSDEKTDESVWRSFWTRVVPDFDIVVKRTLTSFGERVRELLTKTA